MKRERRARRVRRGQCRNKGSSGDEDVAGKEEIGIGIGASVPFWRTSWPSLSALTLVSWTNSSVFNLKISYCPSSSAQFASTGNHHYRQQNNKKRNNTIHQQTIANKRLRTPLPTNTNRDTDTMGQAKGPGRRERELLCFSAFLLSVIDHGSHRKSIASGQCTDMILFLRHTRLHQKWWRCKNRLGSNWVGVWLDSRGVWKFLGLICGGNFYVVGIGRSRLVDYITRRAWRGDSLVWIAVIRERKDTRGTQKGDKKTTGMARTESINRWMGLRGECLQKRRASSSSSLASRAIHVESLDWATSWNPKVRRRFSMFTLNLTRKGQPRRLKQNIARTALL